MNYQQKRAKSIMKLFPKPISGKGFVNSLIDKLPMELHIPFYNYAGPGTNLELRLEKGIKPVNGLDHASMMHDVSYSRSKDPTIRSAADAVLQEAAWKRFKDPNASVGEKAASWLTTAAMKAKRAMGAGLKKRKSTTYKDFPVNLDESEKALILSSAEQKKPVNVSVNLFRTRESIINDTTLPLTNYQIKKLKKARKENKTSMKIKLSAKQIQHFKTGGFLPALLAAAPVVASVLGTIYNSYENKKTNNRLVQERIRHNQAMEEQGGSLKKRSRKRKGTGLYMNKKPKALNGGSLKKRTRKGTGLYMNKKPKMLSGGSLKKKTRKRKMLTGGSVMNPLLKELLLKKKTLR